MQQLRKPSFPLVAEIGAAMAFSYGLGYWNPEMAPDRGDCLRATKRSTASWESDGAIDKTQIVPVADAFRYGGSERLLVDITDRVEKCSIFRSLMLLSTRRSRIAAGKTPMPGESFMRGRYVYTRVQRLIESLLPQWMATFFEPEGDHQSSMQATA
jgi:hypothetical protein